MFDVAGRHGGKTMAGDHFENLNLRLSGGGDGVAVRFSHIVSLFDQALLIRDSVAYFGS
jgi:hypothetical protein